MGTEIYATLEIRRKEMRFVVARYRAGRTSVIFKEVFRGDLLNQTDVVNDSNYLGTKLKRIINHFEKSFNYQITSIILVLPSKTLQIMTRDLNHNLNETVPISEQTMQEVHEKIVQSNNVIGYDNIIIRPFSYKILNAEESLLPPIGFRSNFILTQAKIYSVQKEVSKTHEEVIKKAGKHVLLKTIDMFALGKQVASDINFKNTFALINWGYENTSIGIYSKEALGESFTINKGTKDIVEAVAEKIKAKPRDVEKYLFKLINCSNDAIVKSDLAFRKFNSSTQTCINLSSTQLKELFVTEIKKIIQEIEAKVISAFKAPTPVTIYYFGRITEVAGFADILRDCKLANLTKIYYSNSIGGDELWVTACLGSVAMQRTLNKSHPQYFRTSIGGFMKPSSENTTTQYQTQVYNQNKTQTHLQTQTMNYVKQNPNISQQMNGYVPTQNVGGVNMNGVNQQNYSQVQNQRYNDIAHQQSPAWGQPNQVNPQAIVQQNHAQRPQNIAPMSQNGFNQQPQTLYQNVQTQRVVNQVPNPQGFVNQNQPLYNNRPLSQEEIYYQQQIFNKNNNNF